MLVVLWSALVEFRLARRDGELQHKNDNAGLFIRKINLLLKMSIEILYHHRSFK
jgi:hypothetical protein